MDERTNERYGSTFRRRPRKFDPFDCALSGGEAQRIEEKYLDGYSRAEVEKATGAAGALYQWALFVCHLVRKRMPLNHPEAHALPRLESCFGKPGGQKHQNQHQRKAHARASVRHTPGKKFAYRDSRVGSGDEQKAKKSTPTTPAAAAKKKGAAASSWGNASASPKTTYEPFVPLARVPAVRMMPRKSPKRRSLQRTLSLDDVPLGVSLDGPSSCRQQRGEGEGRKGEGTGSAGSTSSDEPGSVRTPLNARRTAPEVQSWPTSKEDGQQQQQQQQSPGGSSSADDPEQDEEEEEEAKLEGQEEQEHHGRVRKQQQELRVALV